MHETWVQSRLHPNQEKRKPILVEKVVRSAREQVGRRLKRQKRLLLPLKDLQLPPFSRKRLTRTQKATHLLYRSWGVLFKFFPEASRFIPFWPPLSSTEPSPSSVHPPHVVCCPFSCLAHTVRSQKYPQLSLYTQQRKPPAPKQVLKTNLEPKTCCPSSFPRSDKMWASLGTPQHILATISLLRQPLRWGLSQSQVTEFSPKTPFKKGCLNPWKNWDQGHPFSLQLSTALPENSYHRRYVVEWRNAFSISKQPL